MEKNLYKQVLYVSAKFLIIAVISQTLGSVNVSPDNYEYPLKVYNVGVLMASHLNSPFDLERCGPAVDLALTEVNDFLSIHNVKLRKVQESYPSCSGAAAPGLAADMHFRDNVIAFIGPACAFALEPVALLAAYWNIPIITGMGDQPPSEGELSVTSGILGRINKMEWRNESSHGAYAFGWKRMRDASYDILFLFMTFLAINCMLVVIRNKIK